MSSRRVFRNAGWLVGTRILQMIIGLIISTWTVRYLGPANTGVISYVDAFVSFSGAVAILGLNNILVKELIDHEEDPGRVLGTALGMRLLASISCAVLTTILIAVLNPGDRLMVIISGILFTAQLFNSFEIFNFWYQSRLESKVTGIIQTVTYVVMSLYRLFCLMSAKGILWFACASALEPFVIAALLWLTYQRDEKRGPLRFDLRYAKEMLSRSYHFVFSSMMVSIYGSMDSIMIKSFIDTTSVGWYGTATGVNAIWSFVLQALIDSFYPTIVEAHKQHDTQTYHRRIVQLYSVVFWVSVTASLMITVLSQFIIRTLYGEAYMPSASVLRICTWVNTFSFLGVARNAWMVCENNQVYQKYILSIGAAVNLVLNYLWIPRFGMTGAAAATLATQIVTSMIGPLVFRRTRENTRFIIQGMDPSVIIGIVKSLLAERKGKART